MASLFGRIGTQAMKYSFELTITSLHMSIPLTTPMCVKWTRGPRTATNQPVAGVGGTYEWPQGKPMQMSEKTRQTQHEYNGCAGREWTCSGTSCMKDSRWCAE
jgi:hypothetical protein